MLPVLASTQGLRYAQAPLHSAEQFFVVGSTLFLAIVFGHCRIHVIRAAYRAIFGPSQGPECFSRDILFTPINT